MKIAIPADGPDMNAWVENRLGTASWLLVVDTDSLVFEAVEGPPQSAGPGAGIQTVTLALGMGARAVLTGTISPGIAASLRRGGLEVVTGVGGSVQAVVEAYRRGDFHAADAPGRETAPDAKKAPAGIGHREAFKKTIRQFATLLPILLGVVLLVGLFQSFMSSDLLLTMFPGDALQDTVMGSLAGSLMAGNPVNSYVMGEVLLEMGVSLFGAAAFMLAWVNIGLVQLPAEIAALGAGSALIRNLAAFIMVLCVALLAVFSAGVIP